MAAVIERDEAGRLSLGIPFTVSEQAENRWPADAPTSDPPPAPGPSHSHPRDELQSSSSGSRRAAGYSVRPRGSR
jgi:hypothetical protein